MGVEIRWVRSGPEDVQASEQVSDHKSLHLPGDMKQSGFQAAGITASSF